MSRFALPRPPALPLAAVWLVLCAAPGRAGTVALSTTPVASGLSQPVFATSPPGDSTRLFIIERLLGEGTIREAQIRILDLQTGVLQPDPFLHISGLVLGGEVGLLGLAFHPSYPDSPYFYIDQMDTRTRIFRYEVSMDPNAADTTSKEGILSVYQPQGNHNGGWITFGPDGYLYISFGDGGGAGDQGNGHDPDSGNAQSDTTRLGKILRLDIDSAYPYAIPPDNPFFGEPSPKDEFWVKGLRNPWRCSFDRLNGDLYIGDVGQFLWEEIDYQPASSAGGENFGWRKFEGYELYNCPDPCDSSGVTRPVHVYSHGGTPYRCSVTGGYVYRGSEIPECQGTYFFADYCSGQIWSFRIAGGVVTEFADRTAELNPGGILGSISSFGEDASGELYVCSYSGGAVYKIVRDPTGVPGANADGAGSLLSAAVPNPSSAGFVFQARVARAERVSVRVFDTSGRLVRTLYDGPLAAGVHALAWDGRDDAGASVGAATYLLRLQTARRSETRKLQIVR